MAGVHAVLTADDMPPRIATGMIPMLVPNPAIKTPRTQIALARDEVCYVGQTVAVVVADSRYLAEDAAAAVEVDYEPLPAVSDARDAVKPGAPGVHADLKSNVAAFVPMSYGDVDAAFKNAPHVFEDRVRHASRRGDDARRPRGAGELRRRRPTCSPSGRRRRRRICAAARSPICSSAIWNRSASIAPLVGGGFGTKAPFYPEEAVIPAAAMKLGRPVKWQEDRREHFLSVDAGARPVLEGRHRGRRQRQDPRPARHHAARHRRVSAVGHHRAVHRLDDVPRPLCGAGLQDRDHRGADQPRADHGGARRRPAAGGVRDGAADGPRRARTEARPRRGARPQHHPAGADALSAGADLPRRQAAGLCQRRFSAEPAQGHRDFGLRRLPRPPGQGARARAAISASASAIMSKARASARSRASPSASCRTARSRSRPAPRRRARARAPRCRRSSPIISAAGSRTSS